MFRLKFEWKTKQNNPYSIPDLWLIFGMSIEKNILWILIINLG